eukprot:12416297-Karenia_brevis.AAC.1
MEACREDWLQALQNKDVEGTWQVWCRMAEDFLMKRSTEVLDSSRGYKGRGLNRKPRQAHVAAKQTSENLGAQTVSERKFYRLTRQLEELHRHLEH